jgi:hypothetical protein
MFATDARGAAPWVAAVIRTSEGAAPRELLEVGFRGKDGCTKCGVGSKCKCRIPCWPSLIWLQLLHFHSPLSHGTAEHSAALLEPCVDCVRQ